MNIDRPDRAAARPPAHPEYFEGQVATQRLLAEQTAGELELTAVFFDDGARTVPHVHSTDQVLEVLSGRCVIADEHGRREFAPGEFVHIRAGTWHWHGAAPGTSTCHLSTKRPGPTDWFAAKRDW